MYADKNTHKYMNKNSFKVSFNLLIFDGNYMSFYFAHVNNTKPYVALLFVTLKCVKNTSYIVCFILAHVPNFYFKQPCDKKKFYSAQLTLCLKVKYIFCGSWLPQLNNYVP